MDLFFLDKLSQNLKKTLNISITSCPETNMVPIADWDEWIIVPKCPWLSHPWLSTVPKSKFLAIAIPVVLCGNTRSFLSSLCRKRRWLACCEFWPQRPTWAPTSSMRMMKVALCPCSATRRPSVVTTWRPRGAFPGHSWALAVYLSRSPSVQLLDTILLYLKRIDNHQWCFLYCVCVCVCEEYKTARIRLTLHPAAPKSQI